MHLDGKALMAGLCRSARAIPSDSTGGSAPSRGEVRLSSSPDAPLHHGPVQPTHKKETWSQRCPLEWTSAERGSTSA